MVGECGVPVWSAARDCRFFRSGWAIGDPDVNRLTGRPESGDRSPQSERGPMAGGWAQSTHARLSRLCWCRPGKAADDMEYPSWGGRRLGVWRESDSNRVSIFAGCRGAECSGWRCWRPSGPAPRRARRGLKPLRSRDPQRPLRRQPRHTRSRSSRSCRTIASTVTAMEVRRGRCHSTNSTAWRRTWETSRCGSGPIRTSAPS